MQGRWGIPYPQVIQVTMGVNTKSLLSDLDENWEYPHDLGNHPGSLPPHMMRMGKIWLIPIQDCESPTAAFSAKIYEWDMDINGFVSTSWFVKLSWSTQIWMVVMVYHGFITIFPAKFATWGTMRNRPNQVSITRHFPPIFMGNKLGSHGKHRRMPRKLLWKWPGQVLSSCQKRTPEGMATSEQLGAVAGKNASGSWDLIQPRKHRPMASGVRIFRRRPAACTVWKSGGFSMGKRPWNTVPA